MCFTNNVSLGKLSSAALLLPGRHALNASLMAANVAAMGVFFGAETLATGVGLVVKNYNYKGVLTFLIGCKRSGDMCTAL